MDSSPNKRRYRPLPGGGTTGDITRALLASLQSKPVVALTQEEVRAEAAAMPPRRVERYWDAKHNELLERLENDPLDDFLQWSLIQATMFVGDAPYIYGELQYVKEHTAWWPDALAEKGVGQPIVKEYLNTSGNAIHQAYHLARFLSTTGLPLRRNLRILEIGGGYGRLAELIYELGYQPDYTIYDLPAFSLLQRYYLSQVGVPARCVSRPPEIDGHYDLIIGLWSISEMDPAMRYILLRRATASRYLFGLQHNFEDAENSEWFPQWSQTERGHLHWQLEPIEHLNAHYYYYGWSRP